MEASIVWCGAGGFRALSLISPLIYRSKWLLSCYLWGELVAPHRLGGLEKREALSDSLYTLLSPWLDTLAACAWAPLRRRGALWYNAQAKICIQP